MPGRVELAAEGPFRSGSPRRSRAGRDRQSRAAGVAPGPESPLPARERAARWETGGGRGSCARPATGDFDHRDHAHPTAPERTGEDLEGEDALEERGPVDPAMLAMRVRLRARACACRAESAGGRSCRGAAPGRRARAARGGRAGSCRDRGPGACAGALLLGAADQADAHSATERSESVEPFLLGSRARGRLAATASVVLRPSGNLGAPLAARITCPTSPRPYLGARRASIALRRSTNPRESSLRTLMHRCRPSQHPGNIPPTVLS